MEEKDTKVTEEKVTAKAPARKKAPAKTATKSDGNLQSKLAQVEKEKSEMMEMIKSLQEQIKNINAPQAATQYIVQGQGEKDIPITIGCRLLCGATLYSPNKDVQITLKCGQESELTIREMQEIFRDEFGFKRLFEKGVMYFTDPEMYEYFSIHNPVDLSEDALLDILLADNYNDMIIFLRDVTNNKKDDMVSHTICYNTALLFKAGRLSEWSYANRVNFEKYMGIEVDSMVVNIQKAKEHNLI